MPDRKFTDKEVLDVGYDYGWESPHYTYIDSPKARHIRSFDLTLAFEKDSEVAEKELKRNPGFIKALEEEVEGQEKYFPPPFKSFKLKLTKDPDIQKHIHDYLAYEIVYYETSFFKRILKKFKHKLKKIPKIIKKEKLPLPTFKLVEEFFSLSTLTEFNYIMKKIGEEFEEEEEEEKKQKKIEEKREKWLESLYGSYLKQVFFKKIQQWRKHIHYRTIMRKEWEKRREDFDFILKMEEERRYDDQVTKATHAEEDFKFKLAVQTGSRDFLTKNPKRTKAQPKKKKLKEDKQDD